MKSGKSGSKTVSDKVEEIDAQAKTIRDPKPTVRNAVWKQWNAELESSGEGLLDDDGRTANFQAAFLKSSALDGAPQPPATTTSDYTRVQAMMPAFCSMVLSRASRLPPLPPLLAHCFLLFAHTHRSKR